MGLPLLAALFVVLLTVAGAALVAFGTVIQARRDAWSGLDRIEKTVHSDRQLDLPLPPDMVGKLRRIHLVDQGLQVVAGGVKGHAQERVQEKLKTDVSALASSMTEDLLPIERTHHLFAGTWDAATIAFPDGSKHHPRLVLDDRIKNFTSDPESSGTKLLLNAFTKMIPE